MLKKEISRKALGNKGELLARKFLTDKKHKIQATNYYTRHGEIDIISLDGEVLVFTEVRTKTSISYGLPEETISCRKKDALYYAAEHYLSKHNMKNIACRFDFIGIYYIGHEWRLKHYEDIF